VVIGIAEAQGGAPHVRKHLQVGAGTHRLQQAQGRVHLVGGVVVHLPAAEGLERLPVPAPPEGAAVDLQQEDVAQLAGSEDLLDGEEVGGVAGAMVEREDPLGLIANADHLVRLGQVGGHRLLAEHVLAGLHGGDGMGGVILVEGGHRHHLDVLVLEEGVHAIVGAAAEGLLGLFHASDDRVRHGDNAELLGYGRLLHGASVNAPAGAAEAENANTYLLVCHRFLLRYAQAMGHPVCAGIMGPESRGSKRWRRTIRAETHTPSGERPGCAVVGE